MASAYVLFNWFHAARGKLREIKDNAPSLLMKRARLSDGERRTMRSSLQIPSTTTTTSRLAPPSQPPAPTYRYLQLAHSLDLTESYVRTMRREHGLEVMSLGEYLSSLRPVGPTKAACLKDVELLIGAALLRALGPAVGTALLPVLGVLPRAVKAAAGIGGVAVAATAVSAAGRAADADEDADSNETAAMGKSTSIGERVAVDTPAAVIRAVGGLSILQTASAADLASAVARARSGWDGCSTPEDCQQHVSTKDATSDVPTDPLKIMRRGETSASTFPLPNPFIMSEHWKVAIDGMVNVMRDQVVDSYDPDERSIPEPTPVRDVLLPDLHLGCPVRCLQTNRGVLENRLFAILLNKLATVDILDEIFDEEGNRPAKPFVVKMDEDAPPIHRPDALIQALVDSGHEVEATVTTRITTFGLRLCVKDEVENSEGEKERKWIHIPLGFNLRSGLQDPYTGRNISAFMTHGAIDLSMKGPLIESESLMLQYYHNQDGFDGWSSGHYPEADWAERPPYSRKLRDPIRMARLAGLLSCCENSVGSRLRLPLGGYGLTGCCTDSAAAVEFALTGSTGVYPLLGIGAYKSHVVRRAEELREATERQRLANANKKKHGADDEVMPPSIEVVKDAKAIRRSLQDLPNDIHPMPSTNSCTAKRILSSCIPSKNPVFQMMVEERKLLEGIAAES
jgi:hypothetical protein